MDSKKREYILCVSKLPQMKSKMSGILFGISEKTESSSSAKKKYILCLYQHPDIKKKIEIFLDNTRINESPYPSPEDSPRKKSRTENLNFYEINLNYFNDALDRSVELGKYMTPFVKNYNLCENPVMRSINNDGGGDCQFYSIAQGLLFYDSVYLHSLGLINDSFDTTVQRLRELCSNYILIKREIHDEELQGWKIAIDNFDHPYYERNGLKNLELIPFQTRLGEYVLKNREFGNCYWGDEVTLSILGKILGISFVIVNSNQEYKCIPLHVNDNPENRNETIISLFYYQNVHYELIQFERDDKYYTFLKNPSI